MDSYGESVEDHQQSNGHAASNNPDHGWQKVTYPKRHRKQKPGAADPSGQAQGDGNDKPSSVFRSLEKSSEDRRRRILEARAANAAADAPVRSRQHRSDDDGDSEEDSDDGKGNEKVEEKKVKQKKPKKPKVTVADAAAKIDVDHLSAFLADISDKSKWFKRPPWDEQMRTAHDQGTLVLLQNLDPSYTSAEVEVIINKAFGESCTAKMIQRTVFSSYDSGQALAIFKTRDLAELVLAKLDEGCLVLSNGRPLVGRRATPCFPGKQTTFYGHLVIDKLRLQSQREMKEAVSTSHSSQPNTIEYDMAMEWHLLQAQSDLAWNKLHTQQRQEFRKLNVHSQQQTPQDKQTR